MSGITALATAQDSVNSRVQARVQGSRHICVTRSIISFRSVNRRGSANYAPGLQRHHLLPKQLLRQNCFRTMLDCIGRVRVGFDDFRYNGLLLPGTDKATLETGLPLHRGPHPIYNELVIERLGSIERRWQLVRKTDAGTANNEALGRLRLLQRALRIRLLTEKKGFVLNRKDPVGTGFNFDTLDAMAEQLWSSTC